MAVETKKNKCWDEVLLILDQEYIVQWNPAILDSLETVKKFLNNGSSLRIVTPRGQT